jgi:hypothetical protein
MKCPLQTLIKPGVGTHQWVDFFECIKEECAWWNVLEHECCHITIARELSVIKANLYEIAAKTGGTK